MKIFVVGTGRVAKCVIDKLTANGHTVVCGSRHPESIAERSNCKPVLFDLHAEKNEIAETVNGFDAVYFLAGSRGKDLLQTDAFGAVKLMQACETVGINRFVMLSSIFALEPEKWAQEKSLQNITNYNIAKFFADNYLVNCTDLDYTIVQPSVLKEDDGTSMIELDPEHDGSNPIPDVAEVLVSVLERENTFKKIIKMRSGDMPISSAEVITMRKNLGVQPALFPMPVVIVAAYGADDNICAMNAAWAQICDMDKIALFIDADHKTTKNIMETKAFTVSIADVPNMETADFFGIATGNKMPDKFERSGCHAVKSEFVNAPIITEYPVTIECELAEEINTEHMHAIVGKIVNVSAEESVVGDKDKILPEKVNALIFDQYRSGYFAVGEKVGQAWNAGAGLMKK